ncbi:hypothetical protein AYI70_g1317 [Smittium culicis]|uniref:Uncharacterized protein n=1 Tax=Smittium culicis TaxID=133412 RepID=A0A1R1YDQ0_9FUNG|nr:hypothetical protein AYI70_g1317 [Smittium culicis]
MKVWKNHFRNLAQDHSGNNKSCEKWQSFIENYVEIFPESDECISWDEILTAKKSIPNNKSPDIDRIPNEIYKIISDEKILVKILEIFI